MTDSPLKDRTMVVTGAARTGRCPGTEPARRGAFLGPLGHEGPQLRARAVSLSTAAPATEADVTDNTALDDAAGEVRGRLGRPSVAAANAGIGEGGPSAASDAAS
ncbi:hypothetical protein [Streptomyces kebangsaanensis]|uniref:hypothetical protein n=1 Tax=Streptomyces kebangsaanensis TaxID=864058 RepID=UPI00130146C2|nr:hypothetical protein [Streptomyces kebangsaanensis]